MKKVLKKRNGKLVAVYEWAVRYSEARSKILRGLKEASEGKLIPYESIKSPRKP